MDVHTSPHKLQGGRKYFARGRVPCTDYCVVGLYRGICFTGCHHSLRTVRDKYGDVALEDESSSSDEEEEDENAEVSTSPTPLPS